MIEEVKGKFDFEAWSKDKTLEFYGLGNRWEADTLINEKQVIFSSPYPPIVKFKDEIEYSTTRNIETFEFERIPFTNKSSKYKQGLGVKKLEDHEIDENIKASFRFGGKVLVNRIALLVLDSKTVVGKSDLEKDWYVEIGWLIELNNNKTIVIRYIDDFELYFATISNSAVPAGMIYFKINNDNILSQEKTIYQKKYK